MSGMRRAALLLLTTCGFAAASTLGVSASGQFSSSVTSTELAAAGGTWAFHFEVASNPIASNVDNEGFDAPFSGFSYMLNGTAVAMTPAFVRFATGSNLGLFTLFFGPESGIDSNGNTIPEFSFGGAQAFSGSTSSPSIEAGNYAVTSAIYSDAVNFDQQMGGVVTIVASAAPEPSSWGLMLLAAGMGIAALRRHGRVSDRR